MTTRGRLIEHCAQWGYLCLHSFSRDADVAFALAGEGVFDRAPELDGDDIIVFVPGEHFPYPPHVVGRPHRVAAYHNSGGNHARQTILS